MRVLQLTHSPGAAPIAAAASVPPPPAAAAVAVLNAAPVFPGNAFRSREAFEAFLAARQPQLDARHAYEQLLAARPHETQAGTCAPCLRPALFAAPVEGGEAAVPNWREQLPCDCSYRHISRERAVHHLVLASGLPSGVRMLTMGGLRDMVLPRLIAEFGPVDSVHEAGGQATLDLPPNRFQLVVSHDDLQNRLSPQRALLEIRRVLVPAGHFVFSAPFDSGMKTSRLGRRKPAGAANAAPRVFGWDLLDMLRDAGFSDAAAWLYWSPEFGYLGAMNFVFRAIR